MGDACLQADALVRLRVTTRLVGLIARVKVGAAGCASETGRRREETAAAVEGEGFKN